MAVVRKLTEDIVILEKARTQACSTCGSKNSCNISQDSKVVTIKALKNGVDVQPGDSVEIETGKLTATRVAMIVYGIPLAAFLTTLIVFSSILKSEGLAVGLAFASIVVAYGFIGIYDRKNRERLMPRIIRKVDLPDGFLSKQ